jgi:phosphatidylethanolamine/phosphatidyl-N-methylethanolamine N-methyltransferase
MKKEDIFKVLSFDSFIPYFYPALMFPLGHFRKKAIQMMSFKPGDRVLIPGIGSGHDIPYIPRDVKIEGVDISDVMLAIGQVKLKATKREGDVNLSVMDAENLEFPDESFDKAILSLCLTVVYNPRKVFSEVVRVVKTGGEILIYDHLLRKGQVPPAIAKPIDSVMKYSFTSLTRVFEDIIDSHSVSVIKEMPGDPIGYMKAFLLRKD